MKIMQVSDCFLLEKKMLIPPKQAMYNESCLEINRSKYKATSKYSFSGFMQVLFVIFILLFIFTH